MASNIVKVISYKFLIDWMRQQFSNILLRVRDGIFCGGKFDSDSMNQYLDLEIKFQIKIWVQNNINQVPYQKIMNKKEFIPWKNHEIVRESC